MKKLILVFFIAYNTCSWAQDIPQTKISNGTITVQIYLPDAEKGYYRGRRFDWSGLIPQLEFKGHIYFGQWYTRYDPYIHDVVMGPMEAFDPLGYTKERLRKGEPFTKIGVGALQPMDTLSYQFTKPYKVIDQGKWETKQEKGQIEFVHTLTTGGYPYTYKKVIRLAGSKMIIDHTLTNNGSQIIDTDVFNHNFIIIDNDSIGPGYVFRFPFKIDADASRLGEFAKIDGNQVEFVKPLLTARDHPTLWPIKGYSETSAKDYDITVENRNTGAGMHITGNTPLSRLFFWSAAKTLSPEPYVHVVVAPRESFSWSVTYDFYTFDTKNVKK